MDTRDLRDPHDAFDDRLLDEAARQVELLVELPRDELLERLRMLVRRTLTARRPDGTWPATDVLAEVLRSYLDVLDSRDQSDAGGPVPPRWIVAWHEAAESPALLQRLLDELRDYDDTSGVPNYDPPAELRIIVEP
jgi:hypothetical protein